MMVDALKLALVLLRVNALDLCWLWHFLEPCSVWPIVNMHV
jgi:hypothetical protein